jgi:hypothetical protein
MGDCCPPKHGGERFRQSVSDRRLSQLFALRRRSYNVFDEQTKEAAI